MTPTETNEPSEDRWKITKLARGQWLCDGRIFTTQRLAIDHCRANGISVPPRRFAAITASARQAVPPVKPSEPAAIRWKITRLGRGQWLCNGTMFTTQRQAIDYRRANGVQRVATNDRSDEFDAVLRVYASDLHEMVKREYHFMKKRKFRFDFAWPRYGVAVEIDGGQWVAGGGRHNQDNDREKINFAASLGWFVLRFSPKMVENDPLHCLMLVRECMKRSMTRWTEPTNESEGEL